MVYSTLACEPGLTLHAGSIRLNSLPKSRRAATGCPRSAFRIASGIAIPFLTWCEMNRKSLSNRTVQLAFGSAILALLVVGAVSYRSMAASIESGRWVRHTHEVIENLQDFQFALQKVETSYRNFVVMDSEQSLKDYRDGILRCEQAETILRNMTADDPIQQARLLALKKLADRKIQFAEEFIGLRRTKGWEAAADSIRGEDGQRIMDEFQGVVREMQEEELRLLGLRNAEAQRRFGQTKAILILGTVLGVLIAVAAGWSVQRENFRRELAKEGLRDSEEKYRMLLDGVRDYAIFTLDPQGNVASWNAGAERIKGYSADEIIGRNFSCFYPQSDIDQGKPEEQLQIAATSGRSEIEHWRVRKDGSRFWANVVITAARDPSGHLLGFSEISRNITERKETEAKYRGLLEAAPDAMVVVNQDGKIVLLNVQAEKQFGYRRDELVGQKVKNIIPEGFAERLIADGTRTAAEALAQQIGTGIELNGRRKDGSAFPIEIMLSPLESPDGIVVTAAIRDITQRKASEEHLAKTMGELKRSNEELGQFAYIASHDLQEPLRMVASYTQLLSRKYKGKLDADADEFIAFAVDGARRMQGLIQDLLAYSRVGTKGSELVDTSSEEALRQSLDNLRGAIEASGAQVTHDPLPGVLADRSQLIQLFQNLIGNAIKYQRPGIPLVHISASRNGGKRWTFSVQDNGMGIDSQYFAKIFDMFQRLHKREEFDGTGIGLAICKKIVERHGGSISVESQLGQGSTFRFALAESEEKS
jgi:PAS domain S-box-containing protein